MNDIMVELGAIIHHMSPLIAVTSVTKVKTITNRGERH